MRTAFALVLFALAAILIFVGAGAPAASPLDRVGAAGSAVVDRLAPHAAVLALDDGTVAVVPRAALEEAVREGDVLDASLRRLSAETLAGGLAGRTSLGGGDRSW